MDAICNIKHELENVFTDVKYHEKVKAFSGKLELHPLIFEFILYKDKVRMKYNVEAEIHELGDVIENNIKSERLISGYRNIIVKLEECRLMMNESNI